MLLLRWAAPRSLRVLSVKVPKSNCVAAVAAAEKKRKLRKQRRMGSGGIGELL